MTFRLHNLIREDQTFRLQGLLFLLPVSGHIFHVSRFHPWLHSDECQPPHGTISVGAIHLSEHRDGKKQQRRSEEHTSELQSPCNLVCRLLLEKKKKTTESITISR